MISLREQTRTAAYMQQKAPRRTRERILELSLRLFNEFGVSVAALVIGLARALPSP